MGKVIKAVNIFLRIFLASILFWGLFLSGQAKILKDLITHSARKGYFLPLFWCYICITISVLIITKKIWVSKSNKQIFGILFLAAFVPRMIVIAFNLYVPVNDFKNYLEYGQNLYYGNLGKVSSVIQGYQMPKMGGLAVFNWIISILFSPTLAGFQIANCVVTSLTGAMIFLIGKNYHRKIAITASLLWALYPSNIVSSQITANHHASTMFAYLAILFYLYALIFINKKRGYFFALLAGVVIAISNFIHSSVIIFILAILFWSMCLIMKLYGGGVRIDLKL